MNTDSVLSTWAEVRSWDWETIALFGVPALLIGALVWAATSKRPDRRVTQLATLIGLSWMAAGMYDAATTVYQVNEILAGVLFLLFESFLIGAMLRANRYRLDLVRRAKHVRFVWTLSIVAGLIVALAEGWEQAPLRFAVPLLVAGNWYIDLTADDDPADRPLTSWRWTPRRIGLALRLLEPGARDAQTIDRDSLRSRMTKLAFAKEYGEGWVSDLLRRDARLRRMLTLADDADVTEVRARLARGRLDLTDEPAPAPEPIEQPAPEVHPVTPPQPKPKEIVKPGQPAERKQGVHTRVGRTMRKEELRTDALTVMWLSMTEDRPRGMTAAELSALYTPPLGMRTAESFAAEARRTQPVNGNKPEIVVAGQSISK